MGVSRARGSNLYHEEKGDGLPILLIHPAGSTASTWGPCSTNWPESAESSLTTGAGTAGRAVRLSARAPSTRWMP